LLCPAPYLSRKLTRPIPTKDDGMPRTVLDARTYTLGLSKYRELRPQWQCACELLLAEANVVALSRQLERALLYDAKLDLAAMAQTMTSEVILKRAATSRPSGEWNDEHYDVLADALLSAAS
jgi:hypothetical protein